MSRIGVQEVKDRSEFDIAPDDRLMKVVHLAHLITLLGSTHRPKERDEVCKVYNLHPSIVKSYVQFGEVFNLLHAGASYLRVHQKGYGAVGVSNKYGERSYARYPIFWGLKKIGKLPNPDPSDIAP